MPFLTQDEISKIYNEQPVKNVNQPTGNVWYKSSWFKILAIIIGIFIIIFLMDIAIKNDAEVLIYFLIALIVLLYLSTRPKKMALISCPNCKYYGAAYKSIGGSSGVELLLWLFFLLPGLIYSVWRSSTRDYFCPQCKWGHVIIKKEAYKFEDLK